MLTLIENYPALLHKQKLHRTLIISDLHLGWEMNLAQKGIHLPSQMQKTLQKLFKLTQITKPHTLIILGDVKHTVAKTELGEWHDIPAFLEAVETKVKDIQIVRGNHDGNLEPMLLQGIKLHPSTGITLNDVGLFHGHTWPAKKLLSCSTLVMGHVHPTAAFYDSLGLRITTPVWVKAKCDAEKLAKSYPKNRRTKKIKKSLEAAIYQPKVKQVFIMPCFNDFLGGRPVNKKSVQKRYIGPVFRSEALDIDNAEIYLLDGTFLGTIEQLKTFG